MKDLFTEDEGDTRTDDNGNYRFEDAPAQLFQVFYQRHGRAIIFLLLLLIVIVVIARRQKVLLIYFILSHILLQAGTYSQLILLNFCLCTADFAAAFLADHFTITDYFLYIAATVDRLAGQFALRHFNTGLFDVLVLDFFFGLRHLGHTLPEFFYAFANG